MNKYLTLTAAALFAGTAGASATTYTFTFGTSGGGSYCDGGVLTIQDNSSKSAAWVHTNNNCASGTSEGLGLLEKIKGLGKVYFMSDTFESKNYGIFSEQLSYALPAKPKNGATWTLWIGLDGVTTFEADAGVLNNVTKGNAAHTPGKGTISTASVVKQMIEAHGRQGR
jgi:hypothetical protein